MRAFALAALLLLCAPALADGTVRAPESIAIVGLAHDPGSVTREELARLPPIDVTLTQQTDHGPVTGTLRGALPWTLIDRAGPVNGADKNAYIRHTILVTGSDGYPAALGEGEIDPMLEGKQVIIAYMKDPFDGLRLVVRGDAHASRGVHDIATIEVK